MKVFNPNHPDIKKRVEQYISASLSLAVEFILALPVKGTGQNPFWKVEVAEGEKHSFIILKTFAQDSSSVSGDKQDFFREYRLLKQLETKTLKFPKVFGIDEEGTALGTPSFLEESLKGRVLYNALKIKEKWAEELYIKSIIEIQNIKKEDLGAVYGELNESENTHDCFVRIKKELLLLSKGPLLTLVLKKLTDNQPPFIQPCFGNGDFNPKNFLAKDKILTGILRFETAGFFDPLYQFLLPLEKYPLLKNRGLEEAYCKEKGLKNIIIDWYYGLILAAKLLEALIIEEKGETPAIQEINNKEDILARLSKWVKSTK